MGTDIHGWIEVRAMEQDAWLPVADVADFIPTRHSLAFAVVFGAHYDVHFAPVVPKRGLPPDVSVAVRELATPDEEPNEEEPRRGLQSGENWDAHSHTYATWAEIEQTDWDESASKYGWSNDPVVSGVVRRPIEWSGTTAYVRAGARLFRNRHDITRRDAFAFFEALFQHMETLAETYGAENVRVVVWFDS